MITCMEVVETLTAAGVRAEADMRNEKINYKVREHSVGKVPVILAVGAREVEEQTVSVRRLGEKQNLGSAAADCHRALGSEATPPDLREISVTNPSGRHCAAHVHCLNETIAVFDDSRL